MDKRWEHDAANGSPDGQQGFFEVRQITVAQFALQL